MAFLSKSTITDRLVSSLMALHFPNYPRLMYSKRSSFDAKMEKSQTISSPISEQATRMLELEMYLT